MNKFEELCAELDNLDVPYRKAFNNSEKGHYAIFVGGAREGSMRYATVAYCAEVDVFSYHVVAGRAHSIKITKSEEEVLARVARFYFEEYEDV